MLSRGASFIYLATHTWIHALESSKQRRWEVALAQRRRPSPASGKFGFAGASLEVWGHRCNLFCFQGVLCKNPGM